MVRTQISFDKELYEHARCFARRQGISLAELCRRSVAEAISRDGSSEPWMSYIGSIDGAPGDSAGVDEVVYGREMP